MTTFPDRRDPVDGLTRPDGSTEAHEVDHGHVIGIHVNVQERGAKGNDTGDDSAAFAEAEAEAGVGGKLFVPPGTYRLNNWTPSTNRLTVEGVGLQSVLKAKAGAAYAATIESLSGTRLSNLAIDGNAKASSGLCLTTNGVTSSQTQTFDRVRFQNSLVGMKIEDGGAVDQTDKNLYLNCVFADNTTGFWSNATNAQEQLFLGGSFDSHTTAVRLTHGSFTWIGGQVQGATRAVLIDGVNVEWVNMRDVITEGTTTDIDGSTAWPTEGVVLESVLLQGSTYCVDMGISGAILMSKACKFFTGAIRSSAGDTVWKSEFDTFAFGAAWTITGGSNQRRMVTDNNGEHFYFNNVSTPVSHQYITGEFEGSGLATKVKAGIPADGDFFFPVSGMIAVDSSNNRIYVRVGSTWKYAALT